MPTEPEAIDVDALLGHDDLPVMKIETDADADRALAAIAVASKAKPASVYADGDEEIDITTLFGA